MENLLSGHPLLALLWDEYEVCRTEAFVGLADGSATFMPTGIGTWPCAGGVRDQPYLVVRIFAAFLAGEKHGRMRELMSRS